MPEVVSILPRMLREPDAAAYMGIGVTTLQKLVQRGDLPRPKRVSDGCAAHEVSDLNKYLDGCERSTFLPVRRKSQQPAP